MHCGCTSHHHLHHHFYPLLNKDLSDRSLLSSFFRSLHPNTAFLNLWGKMSRSYLKYLTQRNLPNMRFTIFNNLLNRLGNSREVTILDHSWRLSRFGVIPNNFGNEKLNRNLSSVPKFSSEFMFPISKANEIPISTHLNNYVSIYMGIKVYSYTNIKCILAPLSYRFAGWNKSNENFPKPRLICSTRKSDVTPLCNSHTNHPHEHRW